MGDRSCGCLRQFVDDGENDHAACPEMSCDVFGASLEGDSSPKGLAFFCLRRRPLPTRLMAARVGLGDARPRRTRRARDRVKVRRATSMVMFRKLNELT